MKKYIAFIITLSCAIGMLSSCHDKPELIATTSAPDGNAYIKVADFAPNFRAVFGNKPDSFNVYVNNVKVNGSFLTYGSFFPTTSNLYAAVPPGTAAIKVTVNGVTTPDSITLATFSKTLTAGSYYSFLITDSVQTAADPKQIFVQDNFARTDTLHYTIRFAHTLLTDTAGKNVDIWSNRLAANMFSNIAPGTVTAFTTQPYFFISDTLIVRRAGTNFELARLSTVALPIARERAYTLIYKGSAALTSGTKARSLVYYNNQ